MLIVLYKFLKDKWVFSYIILMSFNIEIFL